MGDINDGNYHVNHKDTNKWNYLLFFINSDSRTWTCYLWVAKSLETVFVGYRSYQAIQRSLRYKNKNRYRKNIVLWAGVGGTLPTYKSEDNIKIWSNILLAGPLTSIIFGFLMFPLFLVTRSIFLLMLSLMSIAMGTMCIIPMKMKTGLLYNDGTRYKRIKGGGQEEAEERALFLLLEITLFDGEKVLYPKELIEPLLESKDYELNYYGYYYSYQNAVKINNLEQASVQRSKMEEIKSKVPKIIIDDCRLES